MNALCCQKVWDLSSAFTWQHAFSVSGVTLAANQLPNLGKLTVGVYPSVLQQYCEDCLHNNIIINNILDNDRFIVRFKILNIACFYKYHAAIQYSFYI